MQISVGGIQVQGLKVRGVGQKKLISLPTVITNKFIPDCKGEVATLHVVSQISHIRHLAKNFVQFDENADVLLLIGRDCGELMSTKCFGYKSPYAHRTPIGWALVGSVCKANYRQVSSTEHWSLCPSVPDKPKVSIYNDSFAAHPDDELPGLSQDDVKFIHKISSNIRVNDEGNITMPLPFRQDDVKLPDNRSPVYCRMRTTLAKIKRDPNQLQQCITSMEANIKAKHIEEVPPQSNSTPGKVWYIPVFAVTHPKKGKIRIVWDSKASYKGVSLNNQLLSGPDVNTQLATVLLRFRKGEIAFTGYIESMFYAFHLEQQDRDFTRFFWWKANDPNQEIEEYRANRHVFGNTSSPLLANLGLRFAYSTANIPLKLLGSLYLTISMSTTVVALQTQFKVPSTHVLLSSPTIFDFTR